MLGRSSHAPLAVEQLAARAAARDETSTGGSRRVPMSSSHASSSAVGPALVAVDDGGDEIAGLDDDVAPVVASRTARRARPSTPSTNASTYLARRPATARSVPISVLRRRVRLTRRFVHQWRSDWSAVVERVAVDAVSERFESVQAVRDGLRERRLPGRRGHRRRRLPRRPARQAGARRGPGRHRQDAARQVGRRDDRRPADPPAVLRGPRRVQGALRVELQEAAAAHPGRPALRLVERGPRRHLLRGVPAHPPAARGDPRRRAGRAADRRGRPGRGRDRGAAARDPLRLPGVDPRAGHDRGQADPARVPHVEQHPRAVRGAQAALPLPPRRLPDAGAGEGDRAGQGAGRHRPTWPTRSPASCARSASST